MSLVLHGSVETDLAQAAAALRRGDLVAFPTETVYGLGADATNTTAVARIFESKGRPADNPLIVHMASREALEEAGFMEPLSPAASLLASKLWPGPLTLVVPLSSDSSSPQISPLVTAGLKTVAVRVPKHPVATALLAEAGLPIAAPSANSSGKPSPTSATHVLDDLNGKIHAVLDGGSVDVGIESTVLDVTTDALTILRPGAVTKQDIEELTAQTVYYAKPSDAADDGGPKAPGMKYRHYAPSSPVVIVFGDASEFLHVLEEFRAKDRTGLVGVLAWTEYCSELETVSWARPLVTASAGDVGQVEVFARRLYSGLRWLDEVVKAQLILVQGVNEEDGSGLGVAVMNRIRKAAQT